jgi:hypothetical protein
MCWALRLLMAKREKNHLLILQVPNLSERSWRGRKTREEHCCPKLKQNKVIAWFIKLAEKEATKA